MIPNYDKNCWKKLKNCKIHKKIQKFRNPYKNLEKYGSFSKFRTSTEKSVMLATLLESFCTMSKEFFTDLIQDFFRIPLKCYQTLVFTFSFVLFACLRVYSIFRILDGQASFEPGTNIRSPPCSNLLWQNRSNFPLFSSCFPLFHYLTFKCECVSFQVFNRY